MPRLVRRKPLTERIKDYLDPGDLLLQLAETLNDDTYDEWLNNWATLIGIGLNVLFVFVKLANKPSLGSSKDDVFGDLDDRNGSGSGWFGWLVSSYSVDQYDHHGGGIALTLAGCISRHSLNDSELLERAFHLLPDTELPTIRAIRGRGTCNTIGAFGARRQFANVFLTSSIPSTCGF